MSSFATKNILTPIFVPELYFIKKTNIYCNYPIGGRLATGIIALVSGFVKPLLSLPIAAIGIIVMPIFAGLSAYKKDSHRAKTYLKACGFCCIVSFSGVAFLIAAAYLPLIWSMSLIVLIISLSIIWHVQYAMPSPPLPQ
ncbi:MAG: hypothetical protein R3E91_01245 [Chlamydiales bacterium]